MNDKTSTPEAQEADAVAPAGDANGGSRDGSAGSYSNAWWEKRPEAETEEGTGEKPAGEKTAPVSKAARTAAAVAAGERSEGGQAPAVKDAGAVADAGSEGTGDPEPPTGTAPVAEVPPVPPTTTAPTTPGSWSGSGAGNGQQPGGEPAASEPAKSDLAVAASASAGAAPSDQDATASMRAPSPNGTAHDGYRAEDVTRPVSRPTVRQAPASWPKGATPAPSTGPVPGPGPQAAAPPPWQRVPGAEEQHTSVGVLLGDDEPTTVLAAPQFPGAGPEQGEASSPTQVKTRSRPPRQAALQLKRIDPWSALKLGLVLAVVVFFVWMVAVGVLYGVLSGMGVWDRVNGTYADLVSGESSGSLISVGRVFGLAAVIGAINSLLFAVAITLGAFVYNVSADLVGGIELTLSERD